MKNKRGVSGVITTVLLTLLTISVVVTLWVVIQTFVTTSGSGIEKRLDFFIRNSTVFLPDEGTGGDLGSSGGGGNNPPAQCTLNSDCGNPTQALICLGSDVFQRITTPTCSSNTCTSNIVDNFVENCQFGCANGACLSQPIQEKISIEINASRTSCTAPCAIFFDAINSNLDANDLINSYFDWNFDKNNIDPATTKTAHVFEKPGNYLVEVKAYNGSDIGTSQKTITVNQDPTWTVYCVSNSGTDTSCAPGAVAITAGQLTSSIGTNKKILFKRGEIFSYISLTISNLQGPAIIGAYGTGNKPVLDFSSTSADLFRFSAVKDLVVQDIKLKSVGAAGTASGFVAYQFPAASPNSFDILLKNVEVDGTGNIAFTISAAQGFFVYNSSAYNINRYGVYGNGKSFALINSSIDVIGGSEHIVRIQGGYKNYINGNKLTAINTKSGIEIRGNNDYAVISDNHLNKLIGVNPQNDVSAEYIENVTIERNLRVPEFLTDTFKQSYAINIRAKNVAVRNNLFHNKPIVVSVGDHILVGESVNVSVYGNTQYLSDSSTTNFIQGPFYADGSLDRVVGMVVKNNLIYSTNDGSLSGLLVRISTEGTDVSNNILYYSIISSGKSCLDSTGGTTWLDPQFLSTDPQNINFLKPGLSSPVINTGIKFRGFLRDYIGDTRPKGTEVDIGAYEVA